MKNVRSFTLFIWSLSVSILGVTQSYAQTASIITISKEKLRDKIMGGWAGQTIGVTFGGPYEFQYNGTFIEMV